MDNILSKHTIEHLLSLPHVEGVGYGLKEIAGQLTNQEAIVVMVIFMMRHHLNACYR